MQSVLVAAAEEPVRREGVSAPCRYSRYVSRVRGVCIAGTRGSGRSQTELTPCSLEARTAAIAAIDAHPGGTASPSLDDPQRRDQRPHNQKKGNPGKDSYEY
jgi:hypothetical protein